MTPTDKNAEAEWHEQQRRNHIAKKILDMGIEHPEPHTARLAFRVIELEDRLDKIEELLLGHLKTPHNYGGPDD